MDLIVRSPRIPLPGETIIGSGFQTAPGGKGANQSVAAARAGAKVSHIGRVGDDDFGAALLANMAAAGVDCRRVIKDGNQPSGIALIVVDQGGQNSIVVASGANMQVSIQDVENNRDLIASARVLLLQLEIPLETVVHAAHIAHQSGCVVVLNPAPARDSPEKLLSFVDILIPNESETEILTGLPVESESQVMAAATRLLDLGIETVILTLGERGARLFRREGSQAYSPI